MFLLLGLLFLGKKEFYRTIYGSLLFPGFLALFEILFSDLMFAESDLLLITLYAGGLAGMGFGIVCKYGGSTGGTDIAIKIVKKYSKFSLQVSVYLVEATIIIAGALTFPTGINQGIITALYAIVVVMITGKVSDYFLVGSQSKKAVNIITDHPKELKDVLFSTLRRGVTEIQSQGGFTEHKKTILITVILNTEYHRVMQIISANDPKAFVYVTPASEIRGEWSSKEEVLVNRDDSFKPEKK
ncbi:MAG: YitT family protein [Candidatus Izemoplasmatales bacterium]|nr:YitT family protein [Candidatus Izemoplasmatales bacterium]